MIVLDTGESGFSPAKSPKGMPIMIDIISAVKASSRVAGTRWIMSFSADWPNTNDLPKSPCNAFLMNTRYCCHRGRSRPSALIALSNSSWSNSGLIKISTGLPMTLTPKNTISDMATMTIEDCISLRMIKTDTSFSLLDSQFKNLWRIF